MKNKIVTRLLCITLASTIVVASPAVILASSETVIETPEPTETPAPTPEPTETPVPTPEPTETPTPTPEPTETPTPTPEPTETPTPTPEPTETPEPEEPGYHDPLDVEASNVVIKAIEEIGEVSLQKKAQIQKVRELYDALTDTQKELVVNYNTLTAAEEQLAELEEAKKQEEQSQNNPNTEQSSGNQASNNTNQAIEGNIVKYSGGSSGVSNVHAGRGFYLDELKDTYKISFDEDFAEVMDEIEAEYIKEHKLTKNDDTIVRNWQDILAVYVMRQNQKDVKEYVFDKDTKEDLAKIFAELNKVVRDKKNIAQATYSNMHVKEFAKQESQKDLSRTDLRVLKKYTSIDCQLLCSTVTAAKGFIRQSAGEEISEERVDVLAAAYSLVGKVSYFWGGKSSVLGWDDRWGTAETVSAAGSKSSGTTRAYGLDCSGFVTWAFINGYEDVEYESAIGHGTSDQWNNCETIVAEEAQPGDLVFQRGPEGGSDNHVGFLAGKTKDGDWIAVHCSSSKNGVTVGEAYSASFRYIRRPVIFAKADKEMKEKKLSLLDAGKESEKKDKQLKADSDTNE